MIEFDYIVGRRQGKLNTDEDTLAMIRNHFSVKNDGAFFAKRAGNRFVKDRNYAVTPTGLFDFGIHKEIRNLLISKQITEITYTENFTKRFTCGLRDYEYWDGLKFETRYYQEDAIKKALKVGSGTIVMGTGAGKSLTQALLIENFIRNVPRGTNFKCVIIVPGLSLVNQLQNDFNDYGVTFTYSGWTGDDELQDTQVVICNSENFTAKFLDNLWVLDVDLWINDECHRIHNDAGISKLVSKVRTPNKFGFTGTLSDKLIDRWKTIGVFGPVIYEKSSKELRDEGFLTEAECRAIQMNHGKRRKMTYKDELSYIYNHEVRNEIIKKLTNKFSQNILILVNHLEQGDILFEKLQDTGKQVFFVSGEMPVFEREKIIQKMEDCDDVITIAMSSIFSTGINIKNLPVIFLVGLGKSFIRLVQTIGRGLRLHKNKNKLLIVDFYDTMIHYNNKQCSSEKHFIERSVIYEKEQITLGIKKIDLC
jgi:superfamily II DNA or RNA helicase